MIFIVLRISEVGENTPEMTAEANSRYFGPESVQHGYGSRCVYVRESELFHDIKMVPYLVFLFLPMHMHC